MTILDNNTFIQRDRENLFSYQPPFQPHSVSFGANGQLLQLQYQQHHIMQGHSSQGSGGDNELLRLWALIQELSEQLNENRAVSVALYTQIGNMKSQANHSTTGFVLRRFNMEKTKEEYETEVERMNASMSAENQTLVNDNKQLNVLIKEYEQTLETLMSSFRNRAQDVQERELSLIRDYEARLIALEETSLSQSLDQSSTLSTALSRISVSLRNFLRVQLGGEEPEPDASDPNDPTFSLPVEDDREPWAITESASYALERECELARLEKENEDLRRMLGVIGMEKGKFGSPFISRSGRPGSGQKGDPLTASPLLGRTSSMVGAGETVRPLGFKRNRPSSGYGS